MSQRRKRRRKQHTQAPRGRASVAELGPWARPATRAAREVHGNTRRQQREMVRAMKRRAEKIDGRRHRPAFGTAFSG